MNKIICHNILDVTQKGITLATARGEIYISFDDCVNNFSLEKGNVSCNCVATRDITTLSFTFYTQPKTNVVFKRRRLKDLVARTSAVGRFLNMQAAIVKAGYTSYDLS